MTNFIEPPHAMADDQNIAYPSDERRSEAEILGAYQTHLDECKKAERASREKLVHAIADIDRFAVPLREALTTPSAGGAALLRQAHLLDTMFLTVMRRYAGGDYDDHFTGKPDDKALDLAMRVQKQCMDTLRAHSAISYMQAIAPGPSPLLPLPYPGEQTEEFEK